MKFALFEFEDLSVEVGEMSQIISDPDRADDVPIVGKTVSVLWPGSGGKTKSVPYLAKVIAVNDSKLRLCDKRNKVCNGDPMETDTELGRGKRKQKRIIRDSSSDRSSDSEEDEPPAKVAQKTKKAGKETLQDWNNVASKLREQLLKKGTVEVAISSDDEEENGDVKEDLQYLKRHNVELQAALQAQRKEKEGLRNTILLLQDKIPHFLRTFDKFEERLAVSAKKTAVPHATQPLPCAPYLAANASLDESEDEEHQEHQDMVEISPTVKISRSKLRSCSERDFRKLTNDLLISIFGRQDLHNFSLTGAPNAQGDKKEALDKEKVNALISYVQERFPTAPTTAIRSVITNKLSNEVKLRRKRQPEN